MLKANTVAEYEEINAELMKLFNLDVRYCGRKNMPDIRLELGGFGIPLPKDKKQIELSKHLDWQEYEILQSEEV